MKLPEEPLEFNALPLVFKLIPHKEGKQLSNYLIDQIASALRFGGIDCDSRDEVVSCLKILDEMGVLTLVKKQETLGTSYLLGNLYNGK